jgi:hypothetical protein
MRLALRLLVPGFVLVAFCAGGASANGGGTIAAAQLVPLGDHIVVGKTGFDFWRVQLAPGDRLIIDYGAVTDRDVGLCIRKPTVTDYTRTQSQCDSFTSTSGKTETVFKAPLAGRWILQFLSYGWCGPNNDRCDADLTYEMTTTVRAYTSLTLSAPRAVRAGGSATLRGQLQGASNSNVQLQTRLRGRWQHLATVRAKPNGAFAYRARFRYRGTFVERAFFAGDSAHLACKSKPVTIRVT